MGKISDRLARLAAAEATFLGSEFLAPVVRGARVQVRIAGVLCQSAVEPRDFEGWGVFRPHSTAQAVLVRPATLRERHRYLELLPRLRLILVDRSDAGWLAAPANRADGRFQFAGLVPVELVDAGQEFETIQACFDGGRFWHAGAEPRAQPANAAYLRQALQTMLEPHRLDRPGLSAEERAAYERVYRDRFEASEQGRRAREEERLRQALAHAGAELKEYRERDDVMTVTYEVEGERHTSIVSRADLSVQVAGICLSGEDAAFDLQSLVGVLREADGVLRIGHENQGMPVDAYRRVHPPRQEP
jgi:hypothetical protein